MGITRSSEQQALASLSLISFQGQLGVRLQGEGGKKGRQEGLASGNRAGWARRAENWLHNGKQEF